MAVVNLTKETFEQEVLAAKEPVIIDFWATWCGPCMMQGPIVDALAEEMEGKIKVCKVDVDAQASLALDYGVMNIPTLVIMNQGVFVDKFVGLTDKDTLMAKMNSLLQ